MRNIHFTIKIKIFALDFPNGVYIIKSVCKVEKEENASESTQLNFRVCECANDSKRRRRHVLSRFREEEWRFRDEGESE